MTLIKSLFNKIKNQKIETNNNLDLEKIQNIKNVFIIFFILNIIITIIFRIFNIFNNYSILFSIIFYSFITIINFYTIRNKFFIPFIKNNIHSIYNNINYNYNVRMITKHIPMVYAFINLLLTLIFNFIISNFI